MSRPLTLSCLRLHLARRRLSLDASPAQGRAADADFPPGEQILYGVAGMRVLPIGELTAIPENALGVEHYGRRRHFGAENIGRRPFGIEQDGHGQALGLEERAHRL